MQNRKTAVTLDKLIASMEGNGKVPMLRRARSKVPVFNRKHIPIAPWDGGIPKAASSRFIQVFGKDDSDDGNHRELEDRRRIAFIDAEHAASVCPQSGIRSDLLVSHGLASRHWTLPRRLSAVVPSTWCRRFSGRRF